MNPHPRSADVAPDGARAHTESRTVRAGGLRAVPAAVSTAWAGPPGPEAVDAKADTAHVERPIFQPAHRALRISRDVAHLLGAVQVRHVAPAVAGAGRGRDGIGA